ncbi:hypothetical protein WA026_017519 [Henosepilachna vigintioctopunctata]|uniref:LysM domain-containing protein n=1 Tax=Henosepilachna vigintioctopunctata TaxID=420089 RepID=A0AAW1V1E7_9CUCU
MMKQRNKQKYMDSLNKWSDDEETELFLKSKTDKREIPTVEKTIEDGDTLQSLAIRYHCTIEDIKRLNNIHKENEIYARNSIKVPHKPFSEALAPVHISGSTTPENKLIDIEIPTINAKDLSSKIEKSSSSNSNEVNEIIFNSQIALKPINISEEQEIGDDEEVNLLPSKPDQTIISKLSCSGVDGDISLIGLVLCIVVLIFAAPLIYVFYIAENMEESHLEHT